MFNNHKGNAFLSPNPRFRYLDNVTNVHFKRGIRTTYHRVSPSAPRTSEWTSATGHPGDVSNPGQTWPLCTEYVLNMYFNDFIILSQYIYILLLVQTPNTCSCATRGYHSVTCMTVCYIHITGGNEQASLDSMIVTNTVACFMQV